MKRVESRLVGLAGFAYLALLLASAPPWPDDWDGLGFVASESRFDLDHFAPHPPGYPVYVALLRVANVGARNPVHAAAFVAAVSGLVAAALAWSAAEGAIAKSARIPAAVAVALTPLAWRADTAVGSEAPALALAAIGVWSLVVLAHREAPPARWRGVIPWAPFLLGAAVGLGLGVRLSWAPLYLPLLALAPRGARARALLACAVATLAWAVPLVALVGPAHLVALFRTHFAGHAERWGGTALTDPGAARGLYLARDLVVDGLGAGKDPLGIAIGLGATFAAAIGLGAWKRAGWPCAKEAAIVLLPYLAWIAVGQNLREQPRHALPLVVALAVGLALGLRAAGRDSLAVAFAIIVALRTGSDAYARRTTPPAGEQVVEYVRALPDASRVAVFGGASVRFFEPTPVAERAKTVGTLGDVTVALGRMRELPSQVLVTSEVAGRESARPPLEEAKRFCRPARLDRRAPCLTLYAWRLPYLPAR